jgi:prepilin-type N-terminal cleavage/methylation domain-containing protein
MQLSTLDTRASQRGFTLVELAIVLVIVGLLIGGILKGQQLIETSRMTTTAAQIKAIEAAALTFQDTYNALPGDMANATTRVQNCTAANFCADGNGSGGITGVPTLAPSTAAAVEGAMFFVHLGFADLLDGVGTPLAANSYGVGQGALGAKSAAGHHYRAGTATGTGDLTAVNAIAQARAGTYLTISSALLTAAVANTDTAFTPSQAVRIDRKADDGRALSGSMLAAGAANSTTGCVTAPAAITSDYSTANANSSCNALYMRILQ